MLNQGMCYCDKLVKIKLKKTHITIIRSYKERNISTNTARLAQNSLSDIDIIDRGFINQPLSKDILIKEYLPVFLFPEENAICISEFIKNMHTNSKIQLIVPDGSWRQAKKIKKRENWLKPVQSVYIPGKFESRFFLREQKEKGMVCTIEAINYALFFIENNIKKNNEINREAENKSDKDKFDLSLLEKNLEIMVNIHKTFRPKFTNSKLRNIV